MDIIGLHGKNTQGYRNLELLAKELTRCSGRGYHYFVGNGYLDINRGIAYTTVMCTINGRTIHCLGVDIYELTVLARKEKVVEAIAEMYFREVDCIDFRYKDTLF